MIELRKYLDAQREEVEELLLRHLPAAAGPSSELSQALLDAVTGGGKRVRPILVLAVADLLSKPRDRVEALAAAVEFIHCASLVLDDLPSMDNATLRRGLPALHVVHGEALAILAAVALLMGSTEVLANGLRGSRLGRDRRMEVLAMAGSTVGFDGMAFGQWADLSKMTPGADLRTVEYIHRRKTGKLFELCLHGSAILCGANDVEVAALDAYGRNLGLAFQVKDDLLDFEGTKEELGKDTHQDRDKTTFVDLSGIESARTLLIELIETAVSSLAIFGERADPLRLLADYVRDRRR